MDRYYENRETTQTITPKGVERIAETCNTLRATS